MDQVVHALGPVFLLVMLGYLFKRVDFPGRGFWPLAEKFTYYALFPALLVFKLSVAEFAGLAIVPLFGTLLLGWLLVSLALVLWQRWRPQPGARFTSVYQGSVRFNTYVGLAASMALFGEQGVALAALFLALMIPLVNVLCVLVFARYTGEQAGGLADTLRTMLKNPLILACALGVLLNLAGWQWRFGSETVMALFSGMALPLGLLAVGVGLEFGGLRRDWRALLGVSAVKLVALPLLVFGLGRLFGLAAFDLALLVLFACLPTAPSAYVLARHLGGDASLMAGLITAQTLLAACSMPVVLGLV